MTASPEAPREHKRLSPLAFPTTLHRHKGTGTTAGERTMSNVIAQRHRRMRREACSETMEDASSSPDVRFEVSSEDSPPTPNTKVHCDTAS